MGFIDSLSNKGRVSREEQLSNLSPEEQLLNRQYDSFDNQTMPIQRVVPQAPPVRITPQDIPVSNMLKGGIVQEPLQLVPAETPEQKALKFRQWESFMNQTQPINRGR